jgi:hypothetical protein
MDILESKTNFDINDKVRKFRDLFKYKNNKIMLNGSAALKSQYYFSDFDFSTNIDINNKSESLKRFRACGFHEFQRILNDINNENFIYFIELKIQLKNGKKIRCKTIDKFTQKLFNKHSYDVDFIKIDIVSWIDGRFIEMSCIYDIVGDKPQALNRFSDSPKKDLLKSLKDDINELMDKGKYYKVLKRIFNIYKIKSSKSEYKNKIVLIYLTQFFNSDNGKIYSDIANVEAIKLIFKKYTDPTTQQRIKSNLNSLGITKINIRNINKFIKVKSKIINDNAKQIVLQIY